MLPAIPRLTRGAVLSAAALALLMAASAPSTSAAAVPPGCVPVPDRGPRDSADYVDPQPDDGLLKAVARLRAADPHATFTFSDCEVDSFATRPKPTVPGYAALILKAAGLASAPVKPELYPPPSLGPKPAQDLDGPELAR